MNKLLKNALEKLDLSHESFDYYDLYVDEIDSFAQTKIYKNFHIFGLGGVGSNLVEILTNCNTRGSLTVSIFDDDRVEFHNLNRTHVFTLNNANENTLKTNAIANYLRSRDFTGLRESFRVAPHNYKLSKNIDDRVQNIVSFETYKDNHASMIKRRQQLFIDCRDVLNGDFVIPGTFVKLSYNGAEKISFHFKPEEILDNVVNISNTYEVTPSFAVPPKILSILGYWIATFDIFANTNTLNAGYVELNIDDFINENSFVIDFEDDDADAIIEQYWLEDDIEAELPEALTTVLQTLFENV